MMNELYLKLFNNLIKIYKEDRWFEIMFRVGNSKKKGLFHTIAVKIKEIELRDESISVEFKNGVGNLELFFNYKITNQKNNEGGETEDCFVIEMGNTCVFINTGESDYLTRNHS